MPSRFGNSWREHNGDGKKIAAMMITLLRSYVSFIPLEILEKVE